MLTLEPDVEIVVFTRGCKASITNLINRLPESHISILFAIIRKF